jgi:hypothetical protein
MPQRRDRSQRAQARAILKQNHAMLPAPSVCPHVPAPAFVFELPDAAPQPSLTERARALYEDSVVPVRDIARLTGVSERTIYKYAHRQNWKPRYRWSAGDLAKWRPGLSGEASEEATDESAARGRGWQAEGAFAPAKGAGARFIRREDAGKPLAIGLNANDPAGAARAAQSCVAAQAASAQAEREAAFAQRLQAYEDALALLCQVFVIAPPGEAGVRPRNGIAERARAGCLRAAVLNWEQALAALSPTSRPDGGR